MHDPLELDSLTEMDLRYALIGEKIGSGCTRVVYECRFDSSLVVKIETPGSFDNVIEWKVWQEVKHDEDVRQWLAPCVGISPGGRVLIMKRTEKVMLAELQLFLAKVPRFFHDVHENNWGKLDKTYVCHDYAFNDVHDEYTNPRLWRTKKAHWA